MSFKDVDFARPDPRRVDGQDAPAVIAGPEEDRRRLAELEAEVLKHMTIDTPEFQLRVDEGRVNLEHVEMIEVSQIPFTITGVRRQQGMKLTVSIRHSERVGPETTVVYTDALLEGEQTLEVSGLSIEELAAEKMIGWGLRGLPKHFVDLAIIGHRYGFEIDPNDVVGILRDKVSRERAHPELRRSYDANGVRSVGDLARKFNDPARAGALHADRYERQIGTEVVLDDSEERHIEGLEEAATVKRFVREHWGTMLDALATER